MPERDLDRWLRPRYVLPLLLLFIIVVALLSPSTDSGTSYGRLTTYYTDPYGARGLYQVLQRLGWNVQRRRRALTAPLDSAATYAVLAPPLELSSVEVGTLLDAVRAGATAIIVPEDGTPLADSVGVRRSRYTADITPQPGRFPLRPAGEDTAHDDVPHVGPDEADSVADSTADPLATSAADAVSHDAPADEPDSVVALDRPVPDLGAYAGAMGTLHHYLRPLAPRRGETAHAFPRDAAGLAFVRARGTVHPEIIARRLGRGYVVALADASFMRNGVFRKGDPALLAVRLFEWADSTRRGAIVFDEYHQGFQDEEAVPGIIAHALFGTPAGRMVVQLAVAGLVLLLVLGVRPIAPRARTRIERRSPLEHIGALSRAYEQIEATQLAARRLLAGLRRRHPLGATGALDDSAYLDVLLARAPAVAGDVDVLRAALARSLRADEFVAVGAAIDHIEMTLTPT